MSKQKLSVDNLFYQQEIITTEEWNIDWECCPTQRDHEERAKKPKHQKKFKKIHADHLEVNGVILTKDCVCTETGKEYTKILKQIIDQNSLTDFENVVLTNTVIKKALDL